MPPNDPPRTWTAADIQVLSPIESIRKRPGMYVGSTEFFGFIHYLVGAVALHLANGPRWLTVTATAAGFEVESDARLRLEPTLDGRIIPFEAFERLASWHRYEGCVLTALSESLAVRIADATGTRTLSYRQGQRVGETTSPATGAGMHLAFAPDATIFTVTTVAPAIVASYLRRLSFLHPSVRFRLQAGETAREYANPGGIRALFDSVAAPYQLLHEPIAVQGSAGDLKLELVCAYQSWIKPEVWCFINNGRAAEGGTHEAGLLKAFDRLQTVLPLPKRQKKHRNGVVAVLSILYPPVVWEGCIKARVGNPELVDLVANLVVDLVRQWAADHPAATLALREMQVFTFPEIWTS